MSVPLGKIEKAVRGCFAPEEAARVSYYTPDQFIAHLRELAAKQPPANTPEEIRIGKYRIKRKTAELTPKEAAEREVAAVRMLVETMRAKS